MEGLNSKIQEKIVEIEVELIFKNSTIDFIKNEISILETAKIEANDEAKKNIDSQIAQLNANVKTISGDVKFLTFMKDKFENELQPSNVINIEK